MKTNKIIKGLLVGTILFLFSVVARSENKIAKKEMAPVIKRYKEEGIPPAINLLEDIWDEVEEKYLDSSFFKTYVWYEAQARSGHKDEEWGIALFEFLLEKREEEYPNEINRLSVYNYILLTNISERYKSIGKLARYREYIMRIDKDLRTHFHFDTMCTSYPDEGPIFSFLSNARKRNFPISKKDIFPGTQSSQPFHYSYIYGIEDMATLVLMEGDWVRSAELSQWGIQYTDHFAETEKGDSRFKEVCGESLSCVENLATIASIHGYPKEALRIYQEFLAKTKQNYRLRSSSLHYAKLQILKLQIQLGQTPNDALKIADMAYKRIRSDSYYSSRRKSLQALVDKAQIYYDLGKKAEAWKIINKQLKKYKTDKNPRLQVIVFNTAINLALADGGTHPDLEDWLIQVLTYTRMFGTKLDERPLYKKYVTFLVLQGRYEEALILQRELVRLNRSLALKNPLRESKETLDQIKKHLEKAKEEQRLAHASNATTHTTSAATASSKTIKNNTPTDSADQETTIAPAIDLQPAQSYSVALSGHAAIGRFFLFNPASISQSGTLVLEGRIDSIQQKNKTLLTLSVDPSFSNTTNSQSISLEPETFCIIDAIAPETLNKKTTKIKYTWIPNNKEQKEKTAIWEYGFDTTGTQTSVIDTHTIQSNPYYLIPIHHTIQRVDSSTKQIVDYTVESSSPMRIESYNALTGKLIAVDANGDGDFLDQGDFIASDENMNNWPDLTFIGGERLSSIIFYIEPNTTGEDQKLTIKLKTEEGWKIDTVDIIHPVK